MGNYFDIIIKNATIIDGSGSPRKTGDLGITDGRIVRIGTVEGSAKRSIDGSGKIVCPGFVDPHNHADLFILDVPLTPVLARQGITTYACGNCGISVAPHGRGEYARDLSRTFGFSLHGGWDSFEEWLDIVEGEGISLNMIPFAGHNAIRSSILGSEFSRPSTAEEMKALGLLTEQVLEEGAHGITLGLDGGTPGFFADFSELVELGRIIGRYNGILMPHTRHHQYNWAASKSPRDKGYGIYYGPPSEAFLGRYHGHAEAVEIAENSGVRLHIAHFSIPYLVHQPHPAWLDEELARAALEAIIDSARARGVDVSFDVIPNIESIATERPIIDSFLFDGITRDEAAARIGDHAFQDRILERIRAGRMKFFWIHPLVDPYWFDCFRILSCRDRDVEGRNLGEIVREKGTGRIMDTVYDLSFRILFDLVCRDPEATWAAVLDKRGTGLSTLLQHPFAMPCTDLVVPVIQENKKAIYGISPYTANIFPDYIRRFVREEKDLTLEEGIRKATSLPAEYLFGLSDRGLLKEGYWADVVLFDYENLRGTADFSDPVKPPRGIDYVIVNGEVIVENGNHNGGRPGKVLRRE
ncbi:MAG: amidohydrolase family protein [Spirochaetales bacterium]|nr:amidohydrolase family protein [Spirochaetales bacterium]